MNWSYKKALETLSKGNNYKLLAESKHGLEREFLRTTKNGEIAQSPHPPSLGAALTNPHITTDFSEAQIELVTPSYKREEHATLFLKQLHCFVAKHAPQEVLWPFSMPCRLPKDSKIPIAQYGTSKQGLKRTKYREGLSARYGRKMQTVSGTHYNFSFDDKFWKLLHGKFAPKKSFQQFKSDSYFHIIRNFLKISWINTYLFGSAPAIDKSYLDKKPKNLEKFDRQTYYGPFATSLRMSDIGYYSKVQAQLAISYNGIDQYIRDLNYAISTPNSRYRGLPGLNSNLLQIENEHYSRIRPKSAPQAGERPLEALEKRGVQYLEVRAVDINPYQPAGIAKHQLRFLHMLLVYSLLKPSPALTDKHQQEIYANQNLVALEGRKPGLKLQNKGKPIYLHTWAKKILKELEDIAKLLDKNFANKRYLNSLKMQIEKLENPDLLSSARMIREMREGGYSFLEYGLELARQHRETYCLKGCPKQRVELFENSVQRSLEMQKLIEFKEQIFLEGYEDMELSTQCLMRAALSRGVEVEILDRKENLIRLRKGRKVEYVKQASFTRFNSEITYFLLGNKAVQKKILIEKGISAPQGDLYYSLEHAIEDYARFSNLNVVVKPNLSNYGIGIHFVASNNQAKYKKALKGAFEIDDAVIVEEFVEGLEYRFLVIDYKCVAVLHRRPANVIGDGKKTIFELVEDKRFNPYNYKFLGKLQLGPTEVKELQSQGLTNSSVPKKGQLVYLRKNSNISTGGDPIDFTDRVHHSYKKIAEEASKALNARICGLDMIIKSTRIPANPRNYSIIELNYNPTLQMHMYVMEGKARDVVTPILKLLGF